MTKAILKFVPLVQSLQLANEGFKTATKKKIKLKDITGLGIETMIGSEFIKAESDIIGEM